LKKIFLPLFYIQKKIVHQSQFLYNFKRKKNNFVFFCPHIQKCEIKMATLQQLIVKTNLEENISSFILYNKKLCTNLKFCTISKERKKQFCLFLSPYPQLIVKSNLEENISSFILCKKIIVHQSKILYNFKRKKTILSFFGPHIQKCEI